MNQNVDLRFKAGGLDFLDTRNLQRLAGIGQVCQCAICLALANVKRLVGARIDVQVDVVAKPLADMRCDGIEHVFTV